MAAEVLLIGEYSRNPSLTSLVVSVHTNDVVDTDNKQKSIHCDNMNETVSEQIKMCLRTYSTILITN
jgi:hypothetical protein